MSQSDRNLTMFLKILFIDFIPQLVRNYFLRRQFFMSVCRTGNQHMAFMFSFRYLSRSIGQISRVSTEDMY